MPHDKHVKRLESWGVCLLHACMGRSGQATICKLSSSAGERCIPYPFLLPCELAALRLQLQDSSVCVCDFAPAEVKKQIESTEVQ